MWFVPNTAVLLFSSTGPQEHITPLFRSLHYLSIEYRVQLMLSILILKALQEIGPSYLTDQLSVYDHDFPQQLH